MGAGTWVPTPSSEASQGALQTSVVEDLPVKSDVEAFGLFCFAHPQADRVLDEEKNDEADDAGTNKRQGNAFDPHHHLAGITVEQTRLACAADPLDTISASRDCAEDATKIPPK